VTDEGSVAAFASAVERCDVLVNNAGVALGLDPVAEGDVEDWRRMYDVNVLGTLRVTQALLPALLDGGGHVVIMGSTAGRIVYEGGGGYAAAKHGVAAA
jgi:NADP-dependent 3-hydroxy acid dehydrogenase YdfG